MQAVTIVGVDYLENDFITQDNIGIVGIFDVFQSMGFILDILQTRFSFFLNINFLFPCLG